MLSIHKIEKAIIKSIHKNSDRSFKWRDIFAIERKGDKYNFVYTNSFMFIRIKRTEYEINEIQLEDMCGSISDLCTKEGITSFLCESLKQGIVDNVFLRDGYVNIAFLDYIKKEQETVINGYFKHIEELNYELIKKDLGKFIRSDFLVLLKDLVSFDADITKAGHITINCGNMELTFMAADI